jgi:hypothetical protein
LQETPQKKKKKGLADLTVTRAVVVATAEAGSDCLVTEIATSREGEVRRVSRVADAPLRGGREHGDRENSQQKITHGHKDPSVKAAFGFCIG